MNLEKETIRFKVRKIVVRQQLYGPALHDLYLAVLSYHPNKRKVKEAAVLSPTICCTTKHMLPTSDGLKPVEDIRVGDEILSEINLVRT